MRPRESAHTRRGPWPAGGGRRPGGGPGGPAAPGPGGAGGVSQTARSAPTPRSWGCAPAGRGSSCPRYATGATVDDVAAAGPAVVDVVLLVEGARTARLPPSSPDEHPASAPSTSTRT